MTDKEKFKASHFENIYELIKTCKMWITDDDYDAYCRFFDMGAMEELLNLIEKQEKVIDTMAKELKHISYYDFDMSQEEVKQYFYRKVENNE